MRYNTTEWNYRTKRNMCNATLKLLALLASLSVIHVSIHSQVILAGDLVWTFDDAPLPEIDYLPPGWTRGGGTVNGFGSYVPWTVIQSGGYLAKPIGDGIGMDGWVSTPLFHFVPMPDGHFDPLVVSADVHSGHLSGADTLSLVLVRITGDQEQEIYETRFEEGNGPFAQEINPDELLINSDDTYAVRARAYDNDTSITFQFSIDNLRLTNAALASPSPPTPSWLGITSDWTSSQNWSPAGMPAATWEALAINKTDTAQHVPVNTDSTFGKLTIGGETAPIMLSLNQGTLTSHQGLVVGQHGRMILDGGQLITPRIDLSGDGMLDLHPAASGFAIPIQTTGGIILIDGRNDAFELASPIDYFGPTTVFVDGQATFTGQQLLSGRGAVTIGRGTVRAFFGSKYPDGEFGETIVAAGATLEGGGRLRRTTVAGTLRVIPSSPGGDFWRSAWYFGNSPGANGVPGEYLQLSSGRTVLPIASDVTYGSLSADILKLAGTLEITFENGYEPVLGHVFPLIYGFTRNGDFDTYLLPVFPGNRALQVNWSERELTLRVVPPIPNERVGRGLWSDGNWQTGNPSTDEDAILRNTSSYDENVFVDKNVTVHDVRIAGSPTGGSMTVAVFPDTLLLATDRIVVEAGGRLDVDYSKIVSSVIELRGGTLSGAGPITTPVVADSGTIDVQTVPSWLTLSGSVKIKPEGVLRKIGPAQLTMLGSVTGGVFEAAEGITESSAVNLEGLSIGGLRGGGSFRLRANSVTSVVKNLLIARGESAGNLDLTNSAVVIDYENANPSGSVREQLLAGRGGAGIGASWNGPGIWSSTAGLANAASPEARSIGYADNATLPLGSYASFRGQAVDGTALLVAYTRTGDATLDGVVNDDDVTIVSASYAPGIPAAAWALGDFDYNGFVDDDDVTLLGVFYDPNAPPLSIADIAAIGPPQVTTVPEPAALNFALLCSLTAVIGTTIRKWGRVAILSPD